ncbi:hypothetical protein Gpo141_00014083, partial [Globisporangium polare]
MEPRRHPHVPPLPYVPVIHVTSHVQHGTTTSAPQSEHELMAVTAVNHHLSPLTRTQQQQQQCDKPRPRTSTERGRRYREKRRHHENVLKQQVREIRDEIDRLGRSRSMSCQKALLTRASPHGSLVLLTRELYTIFRHGLEVVDAHTMTYDSINEAARKLSRVQFKEGFLQRVLDPQVVFGDLTGVDAVI